jgi:peptidoglycan/LPS O-acetylase OafA/YrhL
VCVGALTGLLLAFGRIHVDSGIVLVLTICSVTVFARLGELKSASFLRRLAFLGNATYSSYLMHFPIQLGMVMIIDAMGFSRAIFLTQAMFVTYLVLVVGISLAVYRCFELPAQKWIRDVAGQWQKRRASLAKAYN